MACASGLLLGWRARTRSDAARRGASGLPAGARRLGDTASKSAADAASILAETGVRLVSGAPGDHASARLVYGRHRSARISSSDGDGQPSPGDDGH